MFKIICFLIVLYVIIGVLTKDIALTEGLFWLIFLGIVIFVLSIILKFVFSALFIKILLIIAIIAIVVVPVSYTHLNKSGKIYIAFNNVSRR